MKAPSLPCLEVILVTKVGTDHKIVAHNLQGVHRDFVVVNLQGIRDREVRAVHHLSRFLFLVHPGTLGCSRGTLGRGAL